MVLQLHWQSRENPSETRFVAQSRPAFDVPTLDAAMKYLHAVCAEKLAEMPADWVPMTCDETSPHFDWDARRNLLASTPSQES